VGGALAKELNASARRLCRDLAPLRFGAPTRFVYNPLDYARAVHERYVERFGAKKKRVVFMGMNPGPFGMAQTGVPFGEVSLVRDFLGLEGKVGKPEREHPKRRVEGFACKRSEVSGTRVWGAVRNRFGTPEAFFAKHFVANYCPLVFIEASGRNRTPDKLPARESEPLFAACDRHLRRCLELFEPEWIIGVGQFAVGRAELAAAGMDVRVGRILHPSPANPNAQRDWAGKAARELAALGVCPSKD
jgi:single-strand selective monofunctional uracil DNA glycosylase